MELRLKLADDMQDRVVLLPLVWDTVYAAPTTQAEFLAEHQLLLSEALARAFVRATDFRDSGWLNLSRPF